MKENTKIKTVTSQPKQHPISMYLKVWLLLFVLSACSYMVDYFQFQGVLRWTLILVFMLLKAGLIIMVFMHLAWERTAVKLLLFLPPIAILIFIALMSSEADYVFIGRIISFFNP
ncbi:cytochrome C oxidase subunit IV [Colwellia sp. MT41]|uniref:Cytochrome c oxidase subunit IV n=1 Tax=Colwellia marinimaniae TaxID=1513592 RepID=A0ABQ0MU36_9GAMM|nr:MULTISPECIES: cytochrome C oxidase subunit IV family protein [Colwellia]ALO35746.1 cytochrome C oxidase subunit IV [Colwellia sp. MT41]GAW95856.1 cytochrome c oxidase subunit IV [Colwellia marinimaniae]